MGTSISKISLGKSGRKTYSRPCDFDNNTTMDFGYLQPLMSQRLEGRSKIKASWRQLVRPAPMPVPTFGRMEILNEVSFCPISDVFPAYEAMISRQPYSVGNTSYVVQNVPTLSNSLLVWILLSKFCKFSFYVDSSAGKDGSKYVLQTSMSSDTLSNMVKNLYYVMSHGAGLVAITPNSKVAFSSSNFSNDGSITPVGADFIVQHSDHIYCFQLTQSGRRLRSTLIGLGYSLSPDDNSPVSMIPLFAYYKCYFDRFAIVRDSGWPNTKCFAYIKVLETRNPVNHGIEFVKSGQDPTGRIETFFDFVLNELSNTWYTQGNDFMSIHTLEPVTDYAKDVSVSTYDQAGDPFNVTGVPQSGSVYQFVQLELIKRLARFVNKDSVIGKKMSDYLRVHFGTQISNNLYRDVYHVSSHRTPLEVNDVFSTSDTSSGSGSSATGEKLGAYAGKGIGFNSNGFTFRASVPGYLFVFSCIVPKGGYFQGNSFDLYAVDNDTIPFPEFDALGYELTPLTSVIDTNNIASRSGSDISNASFGFVPRYTSLKVKKNVVNGDMSRRGSIDDLSPYYLDRIISYRVPQISLNDDKSYNIKILTPSAPVAGTEWRYPSKSNWLGNFNRIFYNDSYLGVNDGFNSGADDTLIDDHFIVQTAFNVTISDFLKPISMSFDTFEEDTDTGSVNVSKE